MRIYKQRLFSSVIVSLLLHTVVLGFIASGWGIRSCSDRSALPPAKTHAELQETVEAKAVSQSEIDDIYAYKAELKRKAAEEAARKEAARKEAARKAAEEVARKEAARKEAERKAAEEAARKEAARKEAKRKAAEEVARKEAARKEAARRAAEEVVRKEAERKAAEEAVRKEAERKAAEEAARKEAERKAAEEAARKEAERKAAEEAARKEAERKAAEEAARKEAARKAAEEAVRKEAERKRHERQLAIWLQEYIGSIRYSIEKKWKQPPASIKGGDCIVRLSQDENGNILNVNVVSCDGDHFYQRSVEDAVWKATPLPKPPSREVFDNDVEIIFRKEY